MVYLDMKKLNRPDINAVGLGHWVTYKICSNINLAMRDVDLSNPTEEATHGMKRSFLSFTIYREKSIFTRIKCYK